MAADAKGKVFVLWHGAPPGNKKGEEGRAVYIAASSDEGRTFDREKKMSKDGACGCCGMKAFIDSEENLWVAFRATSAQVNRPETLMLSKDGGKTFQIVREDPWNINACPMSTASIASNPAMTLAAWETEKKVFWAPLNGKNGKGAKLISSPSDKSQKHPAVAINPQGIVLFAWAEGTGWERGGQVVWQSFSPSGEPMSKVERRDGLPVWGLIAAWAEPDGSFVVLY